MEALFTTSPNPAPDDASIGTSQINKKGASLLYKNTTEMLKPLRLNKYQSA